MKHNVYNVPAILSRQEAQNILHVSKGTMLRLIQNRQIRASKIGNKYLIRREDLMEFLHNNEV